MTKAKKTTTKKEEVGLFFRPSTHGHSRAVSEAYNVRECGACVCVCAAANRKKTHPYKKDSRSLFFLLQRATKGVHGWCLLFANLFINQGVV